MHSTFVTKYAFRIRTRLGVIVENLVIHGRDEIDAQKKLRQMYRGCEVLACVCYQGGVRTPVAAFDGAAGTSR